jgi:uncharacterized protein
MAQAGQAHLPRPAAIDAYGNGGFRFAGMSHRGSLLCLPDGIHAWDARTPEQIDEASLTPAFAQAEAIDIFLLGTGAAFWRPGGALAARFRDLQMTLDVMPTGAAVRTWNILLAERRRVGAALLSVD